MIIIRLSGVESVQCVNAYALVERSNKNIMYTKKNWIHIHNTRCRRVPTFRRASDIIIIAGYRQSGPTEVYNINNIS